MAEVMDKSVPLCGCGQIARLVSNAGEHLCRSCAREKGVDRRHLWGLAYQPWKSVHPIDAVSVDDAVQQLTQRVADELGEDEPWIAAARDTLLHGWLRKQFTEVFEELWTPTVYDVHNNKPGYRVVVHVYDDGRVELATYGRPDWSDEGWGYEDLAVYVDLPPAPELVAFRQRLWDKPRLDIADLMDLENLLRSEKKFNQELANLFARYPNTTVGWKFLPELGEEGEERVFILTLPRVFRQHVWVVDEHVLKQYEQLQRR